MKTMKMTTNKILLLVLLFIYNSFADPIFYISPGITFDYSIKFKLNIGFKASFGALTDYGVNNLTLGFKLKDITEFYSECQYIPIFTTFHDDIPLLLGGGVGFSVFSKNKTTYAISPRLSAFGGFILFGNITYKFHNLSKYHDLEFGNSLVYPIILSPIATF